MHAVAGQVFDDDILDMAGLAQTGETAGGHGHFLIAEHLNIGKADAAHLFAVVGRAEQTHVEIERTQQTGLRKGRLCLLM